MSFWISIIAGFLLFLSALVPETTLIDSFTVLLSSILLVLPKLRKLTNVVATLWLMV